MKYSIVLPCFNEEGNLGQVIADLLQFFDKNIIEGEIIAVNDGSTDDTGNVLDSISKNYSRIIVIHHNENRGYGSALQTGFDAATGDAIGMMDSDGQMCVEDLGKMMPLLRCNDVVVGYRVKRADQFIRKVYMQIYRLIIRMVFGVRARDINCGMKIINAKIWSQIRPRIATGGSFFAELFVRLRVAGITWIEVPVHHYPRNSGMQTGAHPRTMFIIIKEIILLRYELFFKKNSKINR
ncbi:glycosyltransferase family 2 protein [Patescibacteria group bacterium]|nr:glycosyltransferase family 2 protein [Patescibacteria group bacterium]MBU2259150.1 glycosyltransferase family 2 protein [Patescibacteria group bacterium]